MFGITLRTFNSLAMMLGIFAVWCMLAFKEGNAIFLGVVLFALIGLLVLINYGKSVEYYESILRGRGTKLSDANKRIRELEKELENTKTKLEEAQTNLAEAENNFGNERIMRDAYYGSMVLYMEKVDEWKELLNSNSLSELAISLEKGIAHED